MPFSVVKDLSFLPVDHGVAQNAGMQHQLFDPTQARTEEVLDSFKQRIIFLFNWARGIEGFEILFPLDQKALLRSSVVQIVMLGLALRSQKLDSTANRDSCFHVLVHMVLLRYRRSQVAYRQATETGSRKRRRGRCHCNHTEQAVSSRQGVER